MGVYDRRMKLLDILLLSGKGLITYGWLAGELGVSVETIRTDITALTCSYPIEIIRGYNGGVRLKRGNTSHGQIFADDQMVFLVSIRPRFHGVELEMLDSIIHQVATALR